MLQQLTELANSDIYDFLYDKLDDLAKIKYSGHVYIEGISWERGVFECTVMEYGCRGYSDQPCGTLTATPEDLVDVDAAKVRWEEEKALEAERERQRQEGLRALEVRRTEEHEREQLRKLKAKYETTTSK